MGPVDLRALIAASKPGAPVVLKIWRDKGPWTIELTPSPLPDAGFWED